MKPLTIEQLKALKVGDWVWIEDTSCDQKYYAEVIDFTYPWIELIVYGHKEAVRWEDVGSRYLIYKNKEQAEVKGEIVELPCEIGSTVYCVKYFCDYNGCSQDEQTICCGCKEMIEREKRKEKYMVVERKFEITDFPQIGKKYFTDKSEAERRLAELTEE